VSLHWWGRPGKWNVDTIPRDRQWKCSPRHLQAVLRLCIEFFYYRQISLVLHNLYTTPSITRPMNTRKRWAEHAARMGEMHAEF
jgi:hypothetical protein